MFYLTHSDYRLLIRVELAIAMVISALAAWRGDQAVRAIGWIQVATGLADLLVHLRVATHHLYPWIDSARLALMLAVAWRRPRGWLLWSCTFQLAAVATHVAGALDREIRWVATATALNAWASLSLAALLWGAVEAHLRRRATAGSNAPDSAGESAHEAVA